MSKTTQKPTMTKIAEIDSPKKCPYRKVSKVDEVSSCMCGHPKNKLMKQQCLIIGKLFPHTCPLKEKNKLK